jgi:hypothetical protein
MPFEIIGSFTILPQGMVGLFLLCPSVQVSLKSKIQKADFLSRDSLKRGYSGSPLTSAANEPYRNVSVPTKKSKKCHPPPLVVFKKPRVLIMG